MAEKEDPIQRIEREQAEKASKKSNGGKGAKILAIVLGVILAGVIAQDVVLYINLNNEKKDLEERIVELQNDYDSLSSDYEAINAQLDSSREEVALLVENIKKTEALNRKKIASYEKELRTLRTIMRGYIVQIDSLNAQNRKLAGELASSQQALAQSIRTNEELGAQVETLSSQVAVGSIVKIRGLQAIAENSSGKETDRSSRVVDVLVNMTLCENDLAKSGPFTVYVRMTDEEGLLIVDGKNTVFKCDGTNTPASASRTVDYEGKDVEMGIYVKPVAPLLKGMYTIDVFTDNGKAGSTELLLR